MILDGKLVAGHIANQLKQEINYMKNKGRELELIVFSSDDIASQTYVKNKIKKGEELGIKVNKICPKNYEEIYYTLSKTRCPFIIQKPSNIPEKEINKILNMFENRDADGFSSNNLGKLFKGLDCIIPCTPKGIVSLLNYYGFFLQGKKVAIIGRSDIVGRPLASLLEHQNSTVTLCHSGTEVDDLHNICKNSDIIISATGKINILENWKANSSQILIDVGINRNEYGKMCGDFNEINTQNSFAYTPVPGGIGPMTVISLMENVVDYYKKFVLN